MNYDCTTRTGRVLVKTMLVSVAIYKTLRHPIKMYEYAVLGVPWHD